ncbi:hypothetical protein B0J17DRAFT_377360 [Rhizoctonia solani]|nr:hypothetical protein B0J17DRAFT_377360 [Rhizoctonia solani]
MTDCAPIFPPWRISDWETVDDRIRGGKSTSVLQERDEDGIWFCGTLDITALGGAGFASQRFRFSNKLLRLPRSGYQGLRVKLLPQPIALLNPREFTLVLNTEPITHRPDGRVESRVNWEVPLRIPSLPGIYHSIYFVQLIEVDQSIPRRHLTPPSYMTCL